MTANIQRERAAPAGPRDGWYVAPGDPTCVFPGKTAKPIYCHSAERARLIAAASDLLVGAKAILAARDALTSIAAITELRQAILKAEGRSVEAA